MTNEQLSQQDSAEALTQSSGNFVPKQYYHSAAHPIAALYRVCTATDEAKFVAIPVVVTKTTK